MSEPFQFGPWTWGDEGKPKPEYKEPTGRHLCCGMDAEMKPFAQGDWVPYHEYHSLFANSELESTRLKAELAKSEEHNAALCERLQDLNGEVHTASCANANAHKEINILKAEVAKLKDMTLSMMSEAFTNARYESTVELPEGWNTGIARACELLGEKEKEITELRKAANGIPRLYSTIEFAGQTYVIAMVGAYDAKLKEEEHIPCVDVKLSLVLKDVFDAAKEGNPSV